jgi:hypothetical protein
MPDTAELAMIDGLIAPSFDEDAAGELRCPPRTMVSSAQ